MKLTEFTRSALAVRREERRMKALGYRKHETDWEIHRGLGATDQVILDAKISADSKYVWTKVGRPVPSVIPSRTHEADEPSHILSDGACDWPHLVLPP